jgi:hypothetical protein
MNLQFVVFIKNKGISIMKKTKPSTDLVKQCEQNTINIAKSFKEALSALTAFSNMGNQYCKDHIAKKQFFEGLTMMNKALQIELAHAILDCFAFTGVGGEEALKYAREQFEETFVGKEKYMVMHFLDTYGQRPSFYNEEDDKELRKQLKEVFDKGEINENH